MYSVSAIRDGNEQAFKLFYDSFYSRVYHFVAKRSNNTAETKDLIQEIFIKIWENRHTLTDESSLEALAFTVARNLVVDHYRKGLLQEKYLDAAKYSNHEAPYEELAPDTALPQNIQLDSVIFVPVIADGMQNLDTYLQDYLTNLKPRAFQFRMKNYDGAAYLQLKKITNSTSKAFVAATWADHTMGHDDQISRTQPDQGWGWLIAQGFTILEANRPQQLLAYLRAKKLHD